MKRTVRTDLADVTVRTRELQRDGRPIGDVAQIEARRDQIGITVSHFGSHAHVDLNLQDYDKEPRTYETIQIGRSTNGTVTIGAYDGDEWSMADVDFATFAAFVREHAPTA